MAPAHLERLQHQKDIFLKSELLPLLGLSNKRFRSRLRAI
jgi:hypothetical protein